MVVTVIIQVSFHGILYFDATKSLKFLMKINELFNKCLVDARRLVMQMVKPFRHNGTKQVMSVQNDCIIESNP